LAAYAGGARGTLESGRGGDAAARFK